MAEKQGNLVQAARRGIDLCRMGEWEKGMLYLARVAEVDRKGTDLPGSFYSFLGYGIAKGEGRIREGVRLCRHAIKVSFYEADNYFNLARTYLIAENRQLAVQALERGRKVDPRHAGLKDLQRKIGMRRSPVLPFLSRNNPANVWLGRLRHRLFGPA